MQSPGNSEDNILHSSASSLDIPDELIQLLTEFDQAANSEVEIHTLSPVHSRASSALSLASTVAQSRTSSPNRSIEMPNDEETPRWTIFKNKMDHLQKNALTKINKVKNDIALDLQLADLEPLQGKVARLHAAFERHEAQFEDIMADEPIEDVGTVYEMIQESLEDLDVLRYKIQQLIVLKSPEKETPADGTATAVAAFKTIANAPKIALPTFDGSNIGEYQPFKDKFKFMIKLIPGPKEFWPSYLENNILGEAKKYIGTKGNWHNDYAKLWEVLDDRYANRWNIATDSVKNFFFKPLPDGDQKDVLDWFYEQIDNLNSLNSLGLSVEEVGTSLIIQQFPEEYAKEVRNGLRVSQTNKNKAAFSIKELRAVVNDTIAVQHDPATTIPVRGTLNLHTPTTKVETGASNSPSNSPQQLSPQGQRRSGRGGYQGRNFGRGRTPRDQTGKCSMCDGVHNSSKCHVYTTAEKRREQLIVKRLCPDCAYPKHESGIPCAEWISCAVPAHQGQRHRTWLCNAGFPS